MKLTIGLRTGAVDIARTASQRNHDSRHLARRIDLPSYEYIKLFAEYHVAIVSILRSERKRAAS